MRLTAVALTFLYGTLLLTHPTASFATTASHESGSVRKNAAVSAATSRTATTATVCDPSGTATNSDSADCVPTITNFGTSLFAAVSRRSPPGSNVLVSPLSVAQSLALLTAGATPDSKCETELLTAMRISDHGDLPRLTGLLLPPPAPSSDTDNNTTDADENDEPSNVSERNDDDVSLTTASSAWLASSILPPFATLATTIHRATVHPLPPTYAPMNKWVSNATHSLIPSLFSDPTSSLDPLVRAYLLNVVYFKGSWTERFDVTKTRLGTFRKSDGTDITPVKFMYDQRHLRVGHGLENLGGGSVVEVSYGKLRRVVDESGWEREVPSDYSALFLLPADESSESMDGLIESLERDESTLVDVLGGLGHPREVKLSLPRFKLEYGTSSLKDALRTLGVNEVFDGTNVLLGMSDDKDLHLDDVLHKAVMEVTEEGTVATAATAMKISTRSLPPPPLEVKFDRPFVVCVVHVPTGTPVFLGRVEDPALSFDSVE